MSIAHQSAMPTVAPRARRSAPLLLAPPRRTGYTLAKICGLVACAALGGALFAGAIGLSLVMFMSRIGG
jgi:ABC-type Na+ efflux pump permease subunit